MTATVTAGPRPTTEAWRGFAGTRWRDRVDVRDFIQANYTPYEGDSVFLTGPTERTLAVWRKVAALFPEERRKGILDVDPGNPSTITSHRPGFIDRDRELIVGLQTDAPLRRAIMPNGGLRMVENGLKAYGYTADPFVTRVFGAYRKTHNDGVFDAYTPEMRAARKAGIITGLPDSYGRGRIIGDYRRVALYGTDRLIEAKQAERALLDARPSSPDVIRDREELAEQIRALGELTEMAASYGCDVSRPAATAHEAVQWLYLGFLAAVKEQNGAAMSLGRTSTFLDIYVQRDLDEGTIDETRAQELIDDFVIKLRIVRFLRTPEYDALFSGDPTWVTESIGGIGGDGRTLVTRTSFRFLQTLYNLGPAPEPNLTVLWSPQLPDGFKEFCARVSIDTSAVQYESDDLLRPRTGDDTAIACCVSAMTVGRQMQFFSARVNLAGLRRLPHERQRPGPGDPGGRHGTPGETPGVDDPGLGIRRQLRPPDPRAAARRDQPHLPRIAVRTTLEPVTGRIHSWDLSTGVDGPGTRFVLFLSGSPLRCLYCANPDTWHMRDGKRATVDEVMAEIDKYRAFITAARGGVTLTGGEALLQPAFTAEIFRRCKALGLHTALDTSGFLGARASDDLLADTDLVLLDIKSFDVRTYRKLTGGELAPTLTFATRLDRLGVPVWIRYVLVPGWTDDPAAVDGLGAFLSGLGNVDRVDVLPFHKLGAHKYDALGIPFPLRDTPTPDPDLTERVREQIREHGLRAL